jgi:hypothetical protein
VATGAWTEAVRVAAMRHDTAFFRSPAFRDGIDAARLALRDYADALGAVEDLRTFAAQPNPDWNVLLAAVRTLFLELT